MRPENHHSWLARVRAEIRDLYLLLKKERFFRILMLICVLVLYGAAGIFFADRYYATKGATGFFDAIYWAVVTMATVGYGDIVPVSTLGRLFAITIIASGPVLLSLITAVIASILVERKIKEGQGLETVKARDHVVICGWNDNGEKVIDAILEQTRGASPKIVLVNELEKEEVQSIQYQYKDHEIAFVRGNFVKEDVLARADLTRAKAAIVLADVSGGRHFEAADERTIFGTMAIKSMASKVRTCAELIHGENREHLLRANVDEVIVRGESSGHRLAMGAVSPGLADSMTALLTSQDANKLWRIPVPSKFLDKPFVEVVAHLREKSGALVLAVVREKESTKLEDILSDDSTFIDDFIRRKFEESGKDFFGARKDLSVTINPPDDFQLNKNDWLIVIAKEKP